MLYWALVFLVVALVAAPFGFFRSVAAGTAAIARILFIVFIVLFGQLADWNASA
jgi:uncharacterized membrane protein YtjA (UPF0391 family)